MKKHSASRKYLLLRNVSIILLVLLLLWLFSGVPALSKNQAFRRAMREHFLAPKDAEVFFGEDGWIAALAEVNGVYVQTGLKRSGLEWRHELWSETEALDGVCIVPLFAYGEMINSPEVSVLAEGERADLTFFYNGESHLFESMGKQDGWFLFCYDRAGSNDPSSSLREFWQTRWYRYLGSPAGEKGCSFVFVSYDAEGRELIRVEKTY